MGTRKPHFYRLKLRWKLENPTFTGKAEMETVKTPLLQVKA
jgi:hypothetical protein